MEFHEVANLFPMMQNDEFQSLCSDIAKNGQLEPIWLHEGKIIDGRNRYRACVEVGVIPEYREWSGGGSLVSFVLSLNLERRHLTSGQRAALAVEVLPALEAEARERQLSKLKQNSVSQKVDTRQEEQGRATQQAASLLNTNRQYVSDAKKLKNEAPVVFDKMKEGVISVSVAKDIATLDPEDRQQVVAFGEKEILARAKEIRRERTRKRQEERIEKIASISTGNKPIDGAMGTFPVIYADPPWRYEHSQSSNRDIENQYPTMSLDEICNMPVCDVSTDDCILFLWTTSPKLAESMRVVESWGFTYRTSMVWDKEIIGMGYYARQQHELLLICTKGKIPVPLPENRPSSVYRERRSKHSSKPSYFAEMIESMYPKLPKIELFARSPRDGWSVWGNQSDG